ncbi:hypothetical protein [Halorubrum sp. AJ67]|nr:hypothetical protein [Halorubrum sp. AJ67]
MKTTDDGTLRGCPVSMDVYFHLFEATSDDDYAEVDWEQAVP